MARPGLAVDHRLRCAHRAASPGRDVEEIFIEGARVSYLDGSGRLRGLHRADERGGEPPDRRAACWRRPIANSTRSTRWCRPACWAGPRDSPRAIPPVGDRLSATASALRGAQRDPRRPRRRATPSPARRRRSSRLLMQLRSRVAVSGEPGAGKTTLAAALLAAAPPSHCVRACEEIRELSVPITHGSYYEVRPPALDGTGEIALRDLVKFVLAMRPDRIVVGEVRGAEAFELSRAVNAGCGFLCTVHANSASEALDALGERGLDGGGERHRADRAQGLLGVARRRRPPRSRRRRRALTATRPGVRSMEIAAVVPALRDDFTVEPIFVRDGIGAPLRWTGALPPSLATPARAGAPTTRHAARHRR